MKWLKDVDTMLIVRDDDVGDDDSEYRAIDSESQPLIQAGRTNYERKDDKHKESARNWAASCSRNCKYKIQRKT